MAFVVKGEVFVGTLLLKNARLLSPGDGYDGEISDVLIEHDRIAAIAPELDTGGKHIDLSGATLSPGFIDVHVHTLMGENDQRPGDSHMSADACGVMRGNVAVIDAGTTAPLVLDDFYHQSIERSLSAQYVLLSGLHPANLRGDHLDISLVTADHYKRALERYPDHVLGLKVVASYSHVRNLGVPLVANAKEICKTLNLPLTVHIGNAPPEPETFMHYLDRGDVITHTFHNKPAKIFLDDGTPKDFVAQARKRGVLFDVGHGSASFSYQTAQQAFAKGFLPDLMGTDLYAPNQYGPVYGLAAVLSKMMALGIPLSDCVDAVTRRAAQAYGIDGLGSLAVGEKANLTAFTLEPFDQTLEDSVGDEFLIPELLTPMRVFRAYEGETLCIEPTLGTP
jgi:dihydroorotase